MNHSYLDSIKDIEASAWNQLCGTDYPFLRHEFLAALESSGSVSDESGWIPKHLLIQDKGSEDEEKLVAVMPLYEKNNSYGEYVFDWAWADAYHRNGIHYYPKLLTAIPFTPATGPRIGLAPDADQNAVFSYIEDTLLSTCEEQKYSSWHLLLPTAEWLETGGHKPSKSEHSSMMLRKGCQYHWFNQDYADFEQFLATMTSRKRKAIKRERRRVHEHGIEIKVIEGCDIDPETLRTFYIFYHTTYLKRGQQGYLNQAFFNELVESMPEQLMLVMAYDEEAQTSDLINSHAVAGALFFKGDDTLFGRYWGCLDEYHSLHFETCYYQGIDYCIKHGINKFDPGAQGEHKIKRGFEPTPVWSLHWIEHPTFRQAIQNFLTQESAGIDAYMQDAESYLPFKNEDEASLST